ncbi:hypothetical protein LOK49_LG11G01932 [Camellia lanceoleosa]|uniref:Uncharacterized protein n=1 Tax=Camellia lanceoleosa TaxID=1840588 RepID=A0ACC0FX72_9ERIC|nr:hypothetical protein LOK49_LG11G01932 [Camellia lanceoleosa]
MPKNAMVLTIGASILGQVIGSRAERFRLKAVAEREKATNSGVITGFSSGSGDGITGATHCGTEGMMWDSLPVKASGPISSSANVRTAAFYKNPEFEPGQMGAEALNQKLKS